MIETCYQKYTADYDKKTVHALLTEILKRGYSVSVNDGEEWTLKKSTNINEIKAHLATAEEDWLDVHNEEGKVVGWFRLIYNNGSEYLETICDYSANETCDSIYEAIDK